MTQSRARMPAEWMPHRATWLAWPSHRDLWLADLAPAREEFAALCRGIAGNDPGQAMQAPALKPPATGSASGVHPEMLEILVLDARGERDAAAALEGLPVRFHRVAFGDIWLRDTGPTFVAAANGLVAVRFRFNGWGGKYTLEGDDTVGARIGERAGVRILDVNLTLEGGGVEVDGEGTCLTTRQCVLNPNRNPGIGENRAARAIAAALGVERVVWLERGLLNDHTDGHVDTLARFVEPGVVVCMEARDADDPNRAVLAEIVSSLSHATDARGRPLEVLVVPSPGAVRGRGGEPMPASYLNFYISNAAVVVPTYRSIYDDEALEVLSRCFPGRTVYGSPATAILAGGGAFHCITQQEPLQSSRSGG